MIMAQNIVVTALVAVTVVAQPTPIPNPGTSPIDMISSYAANITTATWHGLTGHMEGPAYGWSRHFADEIKGAYMTRSDPDANLYEYHPAVRGFLNWQVSDWSSNGTVSCVGPVHYPSKDKAAYAMMVRVPAVAYDHGLEKVRGRDNATLVDARRFSWNQTNVPEGCAFEGVDLWVLPVDATTWAPLFMVNADTGCDWYNDRVETRWTGVRPLDAKVDGPSLQRPAACPAVAPPCPKCDSACDAKSCVFGDAPAPCDVDDPAHPEAATCPCRSVATCAEWAPQI